jgi:hypothetical protein
LHPQLIEQIEISRIDPVRQECRIVEANALEPARTDRAKLRADRVDELAARTRIESVSRRKSSE